MLRFLGENKTSLVLTEVHLVACDNYIGGKSLTHKLFRTYFYWLTLLKDSVEFVKMCDRC